MQKNPPLLKAQPHQIYKQRLWRLENQRLQRLTVAKSNWEEKSGLLQHFPYTRKDAAHRQDLTSCKHRRQKHICTDVTAQTTVNNKITTGLSTFESSEQPLSIPIISSFTTASFIFATSSQRLNNIKCLAVTVSGCSQTLA